MQNFVMLSAVHLAQSVLPLVYINSYTGRAPAWKSWGIWRWSGKSLGDWDVFYLWCVSAIQMVTE